MSELQRVLVTGATTPIGRALIDRLLEDPRVESVLAVGIERPESLKWSAADERLTFARVDLTRNRSLWTLMFERALELGITTIVHTASHRSPHVGGARAHRLTVDATRALLEMSERHPTVRRLVYRSHAEVYAVGAATPDVMDERHALNFSPTAPQWIRDHVEADLTACARMGLGELSVAVLRCSECLTPDVGSQLHDYLQSRVCFYPLGYDPMINLISLSDLAQALYLTVFSAAQGVFNIPGADTLPISKVIEKWGRRGIGVPGFLMTPLYRARRRALGVNFDYGMNQWRFHFNGVLDGRRARSVLGYMPETRISWPGEPGRRSLAEV